MNLPIQLPLPHDTGLPQHQYRVPTGPVAPCPNDAGRTSVWPQRGEVHLWPFNLDETAPQMALLDADEQARAARFVFASDRRRYVSAHAITRCVLAHYLGTAPQGLRFRYSRFGKPDLALEHGTTLCFNLSHSQDRAVLAVADHLQLGVDIEVMRSGVAEPALVHQVLSLPEQRALSTLHATQIDGAFLTCWTRKEACLKALGCGLSREPCMITAGLHSKRDWLSQKAGDPPIEITSLDCGSGCRAAVAVIGGFTDVVFRCATPDSTRRNH